MSVTPSSKRCDACAFWSDQQAAVFNDVVYATCLNITGPFCGEQTPPHEGCRKFLAGEPLDLPGARVRSDGRVAA